MRAGNWEFRNRAFVIGMIISAGFFCYSFDHQNTADWLAKRFADSAHADLAARLILGVASLLLLAAACLRTWASAYLHAGVVYADEVKSATLVADGPYRRVRNPLYCANVMMALAMGTMMSRTGWAVAVVLMLIFSLRLIGREEAGLLASQGDRYAEYRRRVPRLWPALSPRVPSSGAQPQWRAGFAAEAWYWGFAAALVAFAITLRFLVFLVILGASLALFLGASAMLQEQADGDRDGAQEFKR